jgi:lipopolysaccharide export system permease protein
VIQRLDRYVARVFLSSWLVSVVLFMGLFGVVNFFSNIGDLVEHVEGVGSGIALVVRLYAYKSPSIFVQVAPFVMLMSALFTLLRLQRHNEFMAMVLTGRRSARILLPIFGMTALCMLVVVFAQEQVVPAFSMQREQLEARVDRGNEEWIISRITMKDANDWVLSFRDFHVEAGRVEKLHASGRDALGRNAMTYGEDAVYDVAAGGWRLAEGRREVRDASSEKPSIVVEASFFQTDIGPQDLLVDHREPFDLSYAEVLDRSARYPHAPSYRLLRHYHITYPLSIMLLVVLGVPFVLKRRARSNLLGVGLSILLCLAYLIVDLVARDMGNRGFLSPVIAAWFPVILAGSLGVVLFDSVDA